MSVELELYAQLTSKHMTSEKLTSINQRNKRLTQIKSYKCLVCQNNFDDFKSFTAHCCGSGHYECSVCKMQFVNSVQLTRHTNSHSGLKPYSCRHCHKEFRKLQNLTRHELTHSGRKLFHCDHCDGLVFFENTGCLRCGNRLAYLPDLEVVGSLDPTVRAW